MIHQKTLIYLFLIKIVLGNLGLNNVKDFPDEFQGLGKINYFNLNHGNVPFGRKIFGKLLYLENPCNRNQGKELNNDQENWHEYKFVFFKKSLNCSLESQLFKSISQGVSVALIADFDPQRDVINYNYGSDPQFINVLGIDQDQLDLLLNFTIVCREQELNQTDEHLKQLCQDYKFTFYIESDKQNVIHVKFFINDFSGLVFTLAREISQFIDVLGDRITFTPVFNFIQKQNLPFIENQDCIDQEFLYCAIDPDGRGELSFANGKDLAMEYYRQLIILKTFIRPQIQWLDYMNQLQDKQGEIRFQDIEDNSLQVIQNIWGKEFMKKVIKQQQQINYDLIDSNNEIMLQSSVFNWPNFQINNKTYVGKLNGQDLIEYCCFQLAQPTFKCQELLKDDGIEIVIQEEDNKGEGVNAGLIVFLVLLISLFIMIIIFFFYRRHIQKKLKSDLETQVNYTMQQYVSYSNEIK